MNETLLQTARESALLCDGAMGTELMALGLLPGQCGMEWNAHRAADVLQTHRAYAQAGCRILTTNSFGGTRTMLARHGNEAHTAEWNRAAATLARQALGPDGWVFGDVGPFGDFLEPLGDITEEEAHAIFREQIEALLQGDADAILIETMSDPAEATLALRAAKEINPSIPVAITYAFQKSDGQYRTMMGTLARDIAAATLAAGADIIGANCGTDLGLEDYITLAKELSSGISSIGGNGLLMIQPNAGAPQTTPDGSIRYLATPEEMAETAQALRAAGATILGGCCGTTPRHLAAMARAL